MRYTLNCKQGVHALSEFWLRVAQTAIGSGLGFAFGIGAFHYQQSRQSKKRKEDAWRASLDALNRLTTAAVANIEALANSKLQFINELQPEIETMKASVSKVYKAAPPNRLTEIQELKSVSEDLEHFYMSLPRTSVMPPPNVSEYSSLSTEMPALTLFVHRAVGMMEELNERIISRNDKIAEHAREGGTGDGMTGERLLYYSSMLTAEGDAICQHTDFALDFWRLVTDQISVFMAKKAKNEKYIEFKLLPNAEAAMPTEELFPLMREQLVTFDSDKAKS